MVWPINNPWSEDEDNALREMAADGATGAEIAISLREIFGVERSRSAVMGRLGRLGIRLQTPAFGGKVVQRGERLREPKPKPKPRAQRKAPPALRPLLPIIKAVVEPPPPPPPPPVDVEPKHFLDIREGECRWPLWSSRCSFEHKIMCAAPVKSGQSYCEKCFKLSRRDPHASERLPGEKMTRRAA